MAKVYQPLGPLLSGAGSRAFLGLEVARGFASRAIVLVWVPDEIAKDPQALAKIERETIRAASLEHPNIIKVYGLATLDEGTARVVEFADGESLRKVLDVVKKLPPRLAALVAADAATGAHHAHLTGDGAPLVHGDIRPETLMVAFSGVCKVAGYGALGVAPKEQGGRRVQGRRTHCAPEQILGGRDAVDRQTDIYLLGLVLYECLTGCVPFTDDPNFEDAVLRRPVPLLLGDDVPPALIKVVEKAMAKKPSDRFRSAGALRDAIEQAVGVLPPHEELERFLRPSFPEDSPERSARRLEIESGIAEQDRRTRGDPQSSNGANSRGSDDPPSPSEVSSPERLSPSGASLHRAKARYVATYVASLLLILAALGYSYLERRKEPEPVKSEGGMAAAPARQAASSRAGLAQPALKPAPEAMDSADRRGAAESQASTGSAPTEIARPALADAPARVEPAVARASTDSAPESSLAAISAPSRAQSALELTVDPPVEVSIDGRAVGRSPVSTALAPGTHVVRFTDPTLGINVSRSIRVAPGGKTSQRLVIGKSVVQVHAPDGAAIYVDGKSVGTAPIAEISVFEGKHRILATLGTAKWQQGFSVNANERMSFKIETIDR
jgi:serine/threonine-protein kinase